MNKDYGNVYSVYVLTFTDGKKYVGLTRQMPEKRWRGGSGYKNQTLVSNAIKESGGWENVKHDIVLENVSLEVGAAKEKELISEYRTQDINYGYNTKNGGQTFGEHSQEFLDSLHERMKGNTYCVGRKISQEHIKALVEGQKRSTKPRKTTKGFKHSEESKTIISEKAKERWKDDSYRQKCIKTHANMSGKNNPMYGRKQSEETREKIRQKALERGRLKRCANDPS